MIRMPGRRLLAFLAALAVAGPAAHAGVAAAPGRIPSAFAKCYACHSLDPEERDLPGPNLHGLLGRRAGALPGFEFSPALREAGRRGLMWTEEALDRFLRDPQAAVPGTAMGPPGLREAAERRAVIDYVKQTGGRTPAAY
jgi:cytochrome c